ncbi:unnamed protein product [Mortierella alpina]
MRFYLLPGLLAVISGALADVTYNVIGANITDGNSLGVSVNGKTTKLTTSDETFPLWSGKVAGVTASSKYRYVVVGADGKDSEKEYFSRSFANTGDTATVNEIYMRKPTKGLKTLPQVYKDVRPKPSNAFDDDQVGVIHMEADPAAFADMMANPLDEERKAIKAKFIYVNDHMMYTAKEVKLKISGHGSRKFKKVSLRIKFDEEKGENFFNRPIIKLRSSSNDPTQMREKLYFDALNAVGVPTAQGAYVRVYVNKKPYGFCLMAEDIETPYIRNTIHGGSLEYNQLGSLYQMGSHVINYEATLLYTGSRSADYHPEIYSNKNLGDPTKNTKEEPMTQLIAFLKDLYEYDPSMAGGEKFWRSRLDLDGFLRSMALEYLGGAWDSYWWKGNNYFMYFNPTKNVWQFLPTDFDSTFSDGARADVNVVYKQFAASRLRRAGKDHPLISKVIYKNTETNKLFEKTLLEITQKLFNPTVLNPRIDTIKAMIRDDVRWDYSIDRSARPGKDPKWTLALFDQSIIGPVTGISHGIKPWIKNRASSVPKQISA